MGFGSAFASALMQRAAWSLADKAVTAAETLITRASSNGQDNSTENVFQDIAGGATDFDLSSLGIDTSSFNLGNGLDLSSIMSGGGIDISAAMGGSEVDASSITNHFDLSSLTEGIKFF